MFWFGRPPYLRWLGAAVLVLGAAVIEFRPTREADYPFAAAPMEAGDSLLIEWRRLPSGLYPPPSLVGTVASHQLAEGEPITGSDVQAPVVVPDGWWALVLEVPLRLAPGTPARLVLTGQDGEQVPGLVIASEEAERFGATGPTALVAVPGEQAARVAAAVAARQIVVLVEP
ncbi:MAG: hypothetical protein ACR2OI_00630 [Acidimicrobiia bacterium]